MKRYIIFALLMTAGFVMGVRAQKRNVLRIPDMTVLMGDAQLPVELENTDEVVALQFDLTIPQGVTLQTAATTTERIQGHKVSVSGLGSERYRVLVLSSQNLPLRGQKGVLFYLPIVIPSSFEEGSVHPLSITDATAIKSTGENVLTEVVAGNLCVSPLPDLTVKEISSDKQTLTPGTTFTVSWLVENVGNLQAQGGWSEQLSLVSDDGTQSKVIATTHYDGTLEAGGVVSRQVEIALPRMLGLSDKARVKVQIVPDAETGESKSGQANNTQTSDSYVYIDNLLALELSPQYVMENTTGRISMKLTRSGRWNKSETFVLTATPEGRITMPSQVTIPAGQSGTVLYLTVNNNNTLDQDSLVNIKVAADCYDAIEQTLMIKDDEQPTLTLTVSPSVVQEGDTLKLTIATDRLGEDSVVVNLASEYSTRFTLPSKIAIPQGQSEVTVDVIAKDDDLPGLVLSNTFTASAPNHRVGKVIVLLEDDDMPALELTLTPSAVSEGDGVTSVSATLRRTTNTNSKITVKLNDDANGNLFFPAKTLQLDKGVNEKNFNFGPIDNSTVDGDRTYTVTAAVWISSCSCGASGESAGSVSAQLQVLDDDGPALRLSSASSVLNEGKQVVLTVSRNTSTDEALTVHLSSDGDERLEYDHDITIPVGQKQQTIAITAIANAEEDDTRNIVFTVQAEGYASSTCWLTLSDKTMADAQILNLNVGTNEVVAGDNVKVAVRVGNTGTASLPAQTKVTFYVDGSATPSVTAYLQEPLQAQTTITIEREVPLPAVVGTHRIQVAVNADRAAQELNYTNNVSSYANVVVLPPFTTTVNVGKQIYTPQEEITISGTISGKSGGEKEVEVYVINSGYRHSIKVTSDAEGHFSTSYLPYSSQTGHFAVGACYPSENLTEEMASFEILAIKRTSTTAITADFHIDETATGTIGISNPSKIPLTGINIKAVDVPTDCNITLDCPNTIAGQSTANITYSINAGSVSQGNDWQQLRIEVTTAEGPSLTIPFYYYCRNHLGHLVSDITAINTTLNIYSSRDYPFTITNIGKGETGKITLSLPSWMTTMTPASMPSLKQGESAQVVLHLTPTEQMQLNIPVTGQIGVNCESGHGFALPFSIEPVSQTTGTLIIDACDENSYFTDEKPHLQGATVIVTHPATGAMVTQGITGDDGIFRQELPEGYYKVKVTAEKHDTYQNNIIISPAQDNNITVNLSLQAITVSWALEETEVNDEYRIETKIDYETNVPVPVVVLTAPNSVDGDNLKPGESLFIPVTLTNKGLIRAENVQLFLPESTDEWELKAISDAGPMALEPGESINIALLLTKKQTGAKNNGKRSAWEMILTNYIARMVWYYEWRCGLTVKSNTYMYQLQICKFYPGGGGNDSGWWFPEGEPGGWTPSPHTTTSMTGSILSGGGSGLGKPNDPQDGGFYIFGEDFGTITISTESEFCDSCLTALMLAIKTGQYDLEIIRESCLTTYEHEHKKVGGVIYENIDDWLVASAEKLKESPNTSSSVCSSVSIQFSQSLVMTRQAFRGTLTIHNGHDTEVMQDIRLNLIIKDEEGAVATEYEFQTNIESLNGFDSEAMSEGIWTLGAQSDGIVTTLFIPTKYAAPTSPKEWSFGGTLTYIDPFTGLEVTRELNPVTLTVKPTPELDLTYFLQRDIYGDDPLTEDIIEPMEPAEFALVINNKGGSDATNVKLTTRQPQIEKNEKGLAVEFSFYSSQLNGNPAQLSFGESQVNDFGTIPAHSQVYAQWWLQSSLLGHFTAYDVEATHVTSYGNENLSLLDKVEVKELIHGFTAGEDGETQLRGFIVNEIEDLNDAPDTLYFSNATTQTLHTASQTEAIRQSSTEYVLRIVPSGNGWNYGSISDPTGGNMTLTKVTDADGTELPLDNVWQTARTMRDGQDWLYETRLHFIANVTAGEIQLHLTFTAEEQRTILDENSLEKPENATDVNVLVRRTMRGGKWNALCLPFTMTEQQISSAFGEKAQVAKFVSWDSERDADDNVIGIDLFFAPENTIEANNPCIVRPETDIMEFTADNVDIMVEDNPMVMVGETGSPAYGAITGTYCLTEVPENSLLLSEGNLQYSSVGISIGAFYAYLEINDVLSNYEDAKDKIRILLIIHDVIQELPADKLRPGNKMFDLSGRAVWGQLRKGIYVSKGKKIVIR